MSKHTPGPYVIDQRSDGLWNVRQVSAVPGAVEVYVALCQTKADAVLFAAAPDLLAACDLAYKVIAELEVSSEGIAAYGALRAAIARARGESEAPQ
jgi:hypothetical protein